MIKFANELCDTLSRRDHIMFKLNGGVPTDGNLYDPCPFRVRITKGG